MASQLWKGLSFPLGVSRSPAGWKQKEEEPNERQDLLSMCHYNNHCYYSNRRLLRATATGYFALSAHRLMKGLKRD